jgi:tripartite-type tricarboxylate transporter receptor subunit TctC
MKYKLMAALGALSVGLAGASHATKSFPSEPVRVIVPYAPGGTTDLLARLLAKNLAEKYSAQVIVENKTGAGGNIAASAVARSEANGYTVMMASIGQFAINPLIFSSPGYNAEKDFVAVAAIAEVPNVLVINATNKIDSLNALLAEAKANPGGTAFASSGNGSSNHLAGVLLSQMAGVELMHVPYKGSAPGLQALYGGDVQIMFDNLSSALPHIKGGRLRALGGTSSARFPQLAEVPTIAELGLPGYEASAWFGIVAPAGTPTAVVNQLNADINEILKNPAISKQLIEMGMTPMGGTPAEFTARIADDMKKWAPVVRDAKLVVN